MFKFQGRVASFQYLVVENISELGTEFLLFFAAYEIVSYVISPWQFFSTFYFLQRTFAIQY